MDNYTATPNVSAYKVELCERKEVVDFIETWHYSKNVNGLTTTYCFKLTDENSIMIGAIIYGRIAMANVWKKYAQSEGDLIELKRLCCIDNTPKNTESFFIAKTIKWLKRNSQYKIIISYADTTYNHRGTIYKASNFKQIGVTKPGKVIMYKGKRYHDKTIRTMYNGQPKPFAKEIANALLDGNAEYVITGGKHIFTYDL